MALVGDPYTRAARITPAVLSAVPAFAFVLYLPQLPALGGVLPALGIIGVVPVAAEVVRGRGRRVERRLTESWGGLPTTRALRYRGNDAPELRANRRAAVEQLTGQRLPTARDERAGAAEADERYIEAVKTVLARLRDTPEGSVLQAENVSFGFRRNLRGLREVALIVLIVAALVNVLGGVSSGWHLPTLLVFAVDVLSAMFWMVVVTDEWVRKQAEIYGKQFFSASAARAAAARR